MNNQFSTQLQTFCNLLETDQLRGLSRRKVDCESNKANCKVETKQGRKYINVDIGPSGRFMVVKDTGQIFGIKGYGVIHRGHQYGTLDTIHDYDWSEYYPIKKSKPTSSSAVGQASREEQPNNDAPGKPGLRE